MAVFKCKMCGASIDIPDDSSNVAKCEYCGSVQTISFKRDDITVNMFNRANNKRLNNDFDSAKEIYEMILKEDDTDAEAYWGIVLCKYGIEYVEDVLTMRRIPTCHRLQYESILSDEDYLEALKYADVVQKQSYEEQAKEIAEVQKRILDISSKESPYDIFICYKDKDDKTGERTEDSVIADRIYELLKEKGYKVFFSRITLEDKLGTEYEPYIFSALNSAKIMIVLGTKQEYFNAVWVKNEWHRYLEIMKKNKDRYLIPCFKDMDVYDLPDAFIHLQALDISKIGFEVDLIRGIGKILSSQKPVEETQTKNATLQASNAFLERAYIFLENNDWNKAGEYFEKALDMDPKCARAYIGKVLQRLRLKKEEDIATYSVPIKKDCSGLDNPFWEWMDYKNAIRFADEVYKKKIEGLAEKSKEKTDTNTSNILKSESVVREFLLSKGNEIRSSYEEIKKTEESISWENVELNNLALEFQLKVYSFLSSFSVWSSDIIEKKLSHEDAEIKKQLDLIRKIRQKLFDSEKEKNALEKETSISKQTREQINLFDQEIEVLKSDIERERKKNNLTYSDKYLEWLEDKKKKFTICDIISKCEKNIYSLYFQIDSLISESGVIAALDSLPISYFDTLSDSDLMVLPINFLEKHFSEFRERLFSDLNVLPTRIFLLADEEFYLQKQSIIEKSASNYKLSKLPRKVLEKMNKETLYKLPGVVIDKLNVQDKPKLEKFNGKMERHEKYRISDSEKGKKDDSNVYVGSDLYMSALTEARKKVREGILNGTLVRDDD